MPWTENMLGRLIPGEVEGRLLKGFAGISEVSGMSAVAEKSGVSGVSDVSGISALSGSSTSEGPPGQKRAHNQLPSRTGKQTDSWDDLFPRLNLFDGMTISFHHCLGRGDLVLGEVLERLARSGLKNLILAPTGIPTAHDQILAMIETGIISHVDDAMTGNIGKACSQGKMQHYATLRSFGGRARALRSGDLHLDLAFIAAPSADPFGNGNGLSGKSACGSLGFAIPDVRCADQVVVITDNPRTFPCLPMTIPGNLVDFVLTTGAILDEKNGIPATMKVTKSPTQLLIAELTARFIEDAGLLQEGFSFHAGGDSIPIATTAFLGERMRRKSLRASFVHGELNAIVSGLLAEGLIETALDIRSGDRLTISSLLSNPGHLEANPGSSYGPFPKGCLTTFLDLAILDAQEIDLAFNVNLTTGSDGWLSRGIGEHQDVSAGAKCTIIAAPAIQKRIPLIRERVTTVTTPGQAVDVLITERGIAVNPRREDLLARLLKSRLTIKPIQTIMEETFAITGRPDLPQWEDKVVAIVEWRDGTILDVVRACPNNKIS